MQSAQPFRDICQRIIAESRTVAEWAEVESDDMFQKGEYVGGFDTDEQAFCFSVYRVDEELWFRVSLLEVEAIAEGLLDVVDASPAE